MHIIVALNSMISLNCIIMQKKSQDTNNYFNVYALPITLVCKAAQEILVGKLQLTLKGQRGNIQPLLKY